MRITYLPRRRDFEVSYLFDGEVITAAMGDNSDVFDFSSMPDGEAGEITSTLDPCPVLEARRIDGELHVTLLRTIGPRPSDPDQLAAWLALWSDLEEVVSGG